MLCEICGMNEATVHLTEIVNDNVLKMHICQSCAKKKGSEMEANFGLADLLGGLADLGSISNEPKNQKLVLRCQKCGMAYNDFKKNGKFGCGACYEAFENYLIPLMRRIHGVDQHISLDYVKYKRSASKDDRQLQKLKIALAEAVRAENFEEAARLRDQVKALEQKTKRKTA